MLVVVCVLGACVGAILLLHYLLSPKILQLKGKHVMVSGKKHIDWLSLCVIYIYV